MTSAAVFGSETASLAPYFVGGGVLVEIILLGIVLAVWPRSGPR